MKDSRRYMVRIPPRAKDKYHLIGEIGESDPASEPARAFWTNASVKALMAQTPQPEYVSQCKSVRGDWRSIQVSTVPFGTPDELCQSCVNAESKARSIY